MSFDQGEFDFDKPGTDQGYRDWQADLNRRKQEFEKRWGVILGRGVRLKLWDRDAPIVGVLHLLADSDLHKLRSRDLAFSINGRRFHYREIESIVREESPGNAP